MVEERLTTGIHGTMTDCCLAYLCTKCTLKLQVMLYSFGRSTYIIKQHSGFVM